MAMFRQGSVGLRVVVQVIDKPVKQLVGGVEIQLLGFTWVLFLKSRAQAADLGGQALFIGRQLAHQARGIGAGQRTAGETIEQFGKVLHAGSGGDNRGRFIRAQPLQQLMQSIEARGDAHEFAVEATEPAVAPTHVRVFKHRDAAQSFKAHRFSDKTHVAGLETFTSAASAQAIGDEQREYAEALVQGVAHGGAAGLRQNRGADQRGAQNPQGNFQHPPHRRHERAVRMGQGRQANHRRRITGKHKPIGAEVTVARRAGGANAHPNRQRAEE